MKTAPPLIDTHCHLDAREFDHDRQGVIERAYSKGVTGILIPAVEVSNFTTVRALAVQVQGGAYAIGIHPMFVRYAQADDLVRMREFLETHRDDPNLVAIGEIGLDFFVPEISQGAERDKQLVFYQEQLKLAKAFDLPVLLHVRKSQDELLKWLRRLGSPGGIAHAFNGSFQQAQQFLDLGFVLGAGGAMTFDRALQIRRLVTQLPLTAWVLETDAPDISPAWLGSGARNEPAEIAQMAQVLAQLRECDEATILRQTTTNACRVLPKARALWCAK